MDEGNTALNCLYPVLEGEEQIPQDYLREQQRSLWRLYLFLPQIWMRVVLMVWLCVSLMRKLNEKDPAKGVVSFDS